MNVKDVVESANAIRKINWDKLWGEMTKVPAWLKCLFLGSVIAGCLYLAYQTFILKPEVDIVIEQVDNLNKRVEEQVESSEYKNDIVYIITALKVVGESQNYIYKQEQEQLRLIKKFLQREHPNDVIITDIDAMMDRNNVEHELLDLQINRALEELGADSVEVQTN